MSTPTHELLSAAGATVTGEWFLIQNLEKHIHVYGTWTGTIDIEVSTNKVNTQNVLSTTVNGGFELKTRANYMRAIFTRSSGSVDVDVVG